jgi:hypothetical protein
MSVAIKSIYSIICSLIFYGAVFSQTCKELPVYFSSYNQAIKSIKSKSFILTDRLPFGKSSWIKNATYYSCDGETGYLVYSTDKGREYIHEKVPLRVWREFKNASSSGSYYVSNIKGRYRLTPFK